MYSPSSIPITKVLAKDATWVDNQPHYETDLELHEAINDAVDLERIEDIEQPNNKKRLRINKQDEASMNSCETTYYVAGVDSSVDSMDTDLSQSERVRGSQNPSALK